MLPILLLRQLVVCDAVLWPTGNLLWAIVSQLDQMAEPKFAYSGHLSTLQHQSSPVQLTSFIAL
jgi:hypothetical protein